MQKRFIIGLFPTFLAAREAKTTEMAEHPDNRYQVRKKFNGFAVVHRVTTHEAEEVIHKAQDLYSKRLKKRSKRSVEDF